MHVEESLLALVDRCVTEHGAHVIEVALRGDRRAPLLQVFIDGVDPVTIDQCTQISRSLNSAIGQDQMLPERYRLEVSTPGVDRPLIHAWQYRKHTGRLLRLVTTGGERPGTVEGVLAEADGEGVELSLADGSRARFPFSEIAKATVRTPW